MGFAMTFYYISKVIEAFAYVQYIMTDVNFNWLIRSIHRWSACLQLVIYTVYCLLLNKLSEFHYFKC